MSEHRAKGLPDICKIQSVASHECLRLIVNLLTEEAPDLRLREVDHNTPSQSVIDKMRETYITLKNKMTLQKEFDFHTFGEIMGRDQIQDERNSRDSL